MIRICSSGALHGNRPAGTSQNNPRIRAGYTFLGQFIDHDLTLDTTSVLEQQVDVEASRIKDGTITSYIYDPAMARLRKR